MINCLRVCTSGIPPCLPTILICLSVCSCLSYYTCMSASLYSLLLCVCPSVCLSFSQYVCLPVCLSVKWSARQTRRSVYRFSGSPPHQAPLRHWLPGGPGSKRHRLVTEATRVLIRPRIMAHAGISSVDVDSRSKIWYMPWIQDCSNRLSEASLPEE